MTIALEYKNHFVYESNRFSRIDINVDGVKYSTDGIGIINIIYPFHIDGHEFVFNTSSLLSKIELIILKNAKYIGKFTSEATYIVHKILDSLEYSIRRLLDFGIENILKNEGEIKMYQIGNDKFGGLVPNSSDIYYVSKTSEHYTSVTINSTNYGVIEYNIYVNNSINVKSTIFEGFRYSHMTLWTFCGILPSIQKILHNQDAIMHIVDILTLKLPIMVKSANN